MITVIIDRSGEDIKALYISGHSGYADQGSDIICAAASTLFYTAVNALEELCSIKDAAVIDQDFTTDEVNVQIRIPELDEGDKEKVRTIMETIVVGFKSLKLSVNDDDAQYIELIESRN
ncbi:MAG: ribosomal-processing cysteine protease Prp [Clostridiales bacterium]|nr:ribosomal-processing cysteine protease Prp [Clostridiales bacterium]